jgi:thymidine kinase
MPALLAVAEYASKMHAVCVRCGGPAHYSQRVSGGNSQIEVGDISYEARCRQCFEPYRALSDVKAESARVEPEPPTPVKAVEQVKSAEQL